MVLWSCTSDPKAVHELTFDSGYGAAEVTRHLFMKLNIKEIKVLLIWAAVSENVVIYS